MRVYKYGIEITDEFQVSMPAGAEILTVQVQHGKPYIWALVDEAAKLESRIFRLAGTGHPITEKIKKYIGSIQFNSGQLVFHLFEIY